MSKQQVIHKVPKKEKKAKKKDQESSVFFRILSLVIIGIAAVICGSMILVQNVSLSRIEAMSRTLEEQEEQAQREYDEILAQINRMGTDEYIEEYARNRLGMVKAGETIYQTNP